MLFPQVEAKKWARIYAVDSSPSKCLKCGGTQSFVIPFAHAEIRGLLSDHERCGEEFRQSVFITLDKSDRSATRELFTISSAFAFSRP